MTNQSIFNLLMTIPALVLQLLIFLFTVVVFFSNMLAYTFLKYNYLDFLAEIFIYLAGQNQFIKKNIFTKVPVS